MTASVTTLVKSRPERWSVSCDFDGTITCDDMVLSLLARFADPAWRVVEAEWEAGRISARECLQRQTELLRVSPDDLADWIDRQAIDPDVAAVFAEFDRLGFDVRVVSDGYDWVIARVMARLGLGHVPVFANRLVALPQGRWSVQFPHARSGCPSGACKCEAVAQAGRRLHIGDGRSDFCVSGVCEQVFAKGALLASRTAQGLACSPFETFAEIRVALPQLAEPRPAREPDAPRQARC